MTDYPKALYTGTKKKRQLATANDDEHEQQLRSSGYLTYDELPDEPTKAVGGECAELQQKWNDTQALAERYQELAGYGMPIPEPDLPPVVSLDYNSWTVKQLRDELERRGVTLSSGANKSELIEVLTNLGDGPIIEDEE